MREIKKDMEKIGEIEINKVYCENCIEGMKKLPEKCVDLIVTSPPYNINIKYGNKHENGVVVSSKGLKYEDDLPEKEYRNILKNSFEECKRILKTNGSIYINIRNRVVKGIVQPPFWILDFFKDMFLKNIIIWNFDWGGSTNKRFSPRYEFVFWFTKDKDDYTFNLDNIKIPSLNYRPDRFKTQGKNPSDVWYVQMVSGNYPERTSHPAQYPEELIKRIILVATNKGDLVLDPFVGSGTTVRVAKDLDRRYLGYDNVRGYIKIAEERLRLPKERKIKKSKDIRELYWNMDDKVLSEFVKKNKR